MFSQQEGRKMVGGVTYLDWVQWALVGVVDGGGRLLVVPNGDGDSGGGVVESGWLTAVGHLAVSTVGAGGRQ